MDSTRREIIRLQAQLREKDGDVELARSGTEGLASMHAREVVQLRQELEREREAVATAHALASSSAGELHEALHAEKEKSMQLQRDVDSATAAAQKAVDALELQRHEHDGLAAALRADLADEAARADEARRLYDETRSADSVPSERADGDRRGATDESEGAAPESSRRGAACRCLQIGVASRRSPSACSEVVFTKKTTPGRVELADAHRTAAELSGDAAGHAERLRASKRHAERLSDEFQDLQRREEAAQGSARSEA